MCVSPLAEWIEPTRIATDGVFLGKSKEIIRVFPVHFASLNAFGSSPVQKTVDRIVGHLDADDILNDTLYNRYPFILPFAFCKRSAFDGQVANQIDVDCSHLTIISPTLGATRTEADFAAHIEATIATDADAAATDARWIFVVDQLDTHRSATLVEWVARHCGIIDPLGIKGKTGILKSKQTRRAFLQDPAHQICFVYTPRHCSWLNQVEIWFSMLARRLLKRASFTSLEDLRTRVLDFISYFNDVLGKPFRWTYTDRPLQASLLPADRHFRRAHLVRQI